MIQTLEDGRIVINLRQCGKCRQHITDLFRLPTASVASLEESYHILDKDQDPTFKFEEFRAMCPRCKDSHEDITYLDMNADELETVNNTPINKILISRSDM